MKRAATLTWIELLIMVSFFIYLCQVILCHTDCSIASDYLPCSLLYGNWVFAKTFKVCKVTFCHKVCVVANDLLPNSWLCGKWLFASQFVLWLTFGLKNRTHVMLVETQRNYWPVFDYYTNCFLISRTDKHSQDFVSCRNRFYDNCIETLYKSMLEVFCHIILGGI